MGSNELDGHPHVAGARSRNNPDPHAHRYSPGVLAGFFNATLDVSRTGTFRRVIVPQSFAGLVTGAVLSFAHTIGEFGVVLMVGGNIEGQTRTVSIAIYDDVQALNYAQANSTALLLVLFSFVI